MDNKENMIRIAVAISFFCMLAINALSFILPFNGRNVAEVASFYPNYFTPPPATFAVWLLIHIFSGGFVIYQLKFMKKNHIKAGILFHARIIFLIYCWLDIIWLIAWVSDYLALSTMVILTVLICLKILCRFLCSLTLSWKDKLFIKLPFSILYGWLTITTVINIVVLFVSISWKGFGIPIMFWEQALLAGIAIFSVYRTLKNRDLIYGLTFLWYYISLFLKQLFASETDQHYPIVIVTVIFCLIISVCSLGYLLFIRKKSR